MLVYKSGPLFFDGDRGLEGFAGFELWRVQFRDGDSLLWVARVNANARFSVADHELPEAGQLYGMAVGQGFVNQKFKGVDEAFSFAGGDAAPCGQDFDKS
jgi:hypothetical protein